jgi:uncharacterized protein
MPHLQWWSAGFTHMACKACHRAMCFPELHAVCASASLWGMQLAWSLERLNPVSSRIRTAGSVEFKLLRSSLEKSGRLDVCNMKLISREFEFERPLQPGMQSPVASSAPGWDPYDVWSTRVRRDLLPVAELPRKLWVVSDVVQVIPEKPVPARVSKKERVASAVLPIVFILLLLLALSRELMGLFGIDVVAAVFGVMTPAARVIHILLGVAALYCAVVLSAQRRRHATGRA